MLDKDGYPTEETLAEITNWDYKDRRGVLEFIAEAWYYSDSAIETREGLFVFATCGWSGNEELIQALKDNSVLWLYLTSIHYIHLTGGFYVFAITDKAEKELDKMKSKIVSWAWDDKQRKEVK